MPERPERHRRIQRRGPIVGHDPQALRQVLELPGRRRLRDIEQPKQRQSQAASTSVETADDRGARIRKNTIGIAPISSSTIAPGSFAPPKRRTAAVQIGTAITLSATTTATRQPHPSMNEIPQLSGTPASAPQVPGANGIRPIHKPVAKKTAGCRQGMPGGGLSIRGWAVVGRHGFFVVPRRWSRPSCWAPSATNSAPYSSTMLA